MSNKIRLHEFVGGKARHAVGPSKNAQSAGGPNWVFLPIGLRQSNHVIVDAVRRTHHIMMAYVAGRNDAKQKRGTEPAFREFGRGVRFKAGRLIRHLQSVRIQQGRKWKDGGKYPDSTDGNKETPMTLSRP